MGIVYKVKKEIIAFVIAQKRQDPKLSCRGLVDIIDKRFGIKVSKSSINAVIKEADLSSRVGRPSLVAQPKVPKAKVISSIPKELEVLLRPRTVSPPPKEEEQLPKKVEAPKESLPKEKPKPIFLPEKEEVSKKPEISQEIHIKKPEVPPEAAVEKAEKEVSPQKKEILNKPEVPTMAAGDKSEETPKEEKKSKQILPEPIIAEPIKAPLQISKLIQPVVIKDDEVFDSMGAFFLKAAEWEISQSSILAELVREHISQIEHLDSEIKSNVLLYLPAFGIDNPQDIDKYDKRGLWVLSNTDEKQSYSQMESFLKRLKANQDLTLRVFDECSNSIKEANYFKFILADGSGFFIDARLKSIWQEPNIPDNFSVSLNKAKEFIEEKIIKIFTKDIQPVILFNVPSFRSFSAVVTEFILAFSGLSTKNIFQIDIFDSNKKELISYKNITAAKRPFIFGFWPWQEEAKEFLKGDIGIVKDFYFPELARKIYYTERSVEYPPQLQGSQATLNLIFLKNSAFSSPRMGLLTNISPQLIDAKEVMRLFLLHWPNFEDTYQDLLASSERLTYRGFIYPVFDEEDMPKKEQTYILPLSKTALEENLKALLFNISTACQRHFFPYGYRFADFSTMKQRFYSLPGKIARKDNNFYISLLPPRDYRYNNDLLYAARRINESEILDIFGSKICFKVL